MAAAEHPEINDATKPGPANPRGSDHLDAPTPPGGPLRSDAPDGPTAPGGPGTPAQPGRPRDLAEPKRPVDEPTGPSTGQASVPDDAAKLSEGQPSDDSGQH